MIKLEKAIQLIKPKQIVLGGGVINNLTIRREIRQVGRKWGMPVRQAYTEKLFTDNAAMIGVSAWYQLQRGDLIKESEELDRLPNLNFHA